ncbi:Uncharacterized protein Rs2_24062 [Raphanus sativus]|uniref:Uncharacterized protein LOC108860628 n=1 Tax=Raphanus sativus TaxID=3726 RepID=A0A6J0NYY4_RAPSA|nr:uncharacterized protein LOC108860628 [Raphanus sativus]KAJ4897268.1 Uncharacterized protein Rs2_24062 [Raphanus sativus]
MEKDESFVYNEVVEEEQSPQSNQTWPMDMIRQRRFQHKMSSLLSPATPKRNYSVSNAKSLLKKYSKSDPIPRRKRFPVSCSDEGVLMDGVLVTSASEKKASDSPSRLSSLGRSPRSSLVRSQHKNSSSPRSLSGGNQEDTTRSKTSSGGKVKMLADSPCTKLETPKAANPSTLKATAEPFTFTPRPSQGLASPLPVRQLPFDHGPRIQWVNPPPHHQLRPRYGHLYLPPSYTYPRSLQVPDLYPTHYPFRSPRPIGYQMGQDPRIISLLPTTPLSTNTSKPPVHTPISTTSTANLSTGTTTHDSRLDSSLSADGGPETVIQTQDSSSPSDELETMTQKQGLLSPSDELVTMAAAELKTSTQKPGFSPSAGLGLETMMTEKDWSPSDDGLPTPTEEAQTDFMKPQDRVLPDDAFQHYIYRKRLPVFTQICSDDAEGCDDASH